MGKLVSNDVLDNLVKIGHLHTEEAENEEIETLIESEKVRLKDANNDQLSIESRFDLAYNASHALALAALRRSGYRSSKRYLGFQCLEQTLDIPKEKWRVLDDAHRKRNIAEYEGHSEVSEGLVNAVIEISIDMQSRLE